MLTNRAFSRVLGRFMIDPKIMQIAGAAAGPWPGVATDAQVVVVPYADLTLTQIKNILPDVIVLPLFGAGFDALDALARLVGMGFLGRVVVTRPHLPRPDLIARELASIAPGLDITLTGPAIDGQVGVPPCPGAESR
jgi:hypothetical protein